jgi:hypothetical protein
MSYFSKQLATTDKIIFCVLILFTLFGVALTNMSPADAHKYWLVMNFVFALGAIFTGWQKAADKAEKTRLVTSQLFHWGTTLVAVAIVYAFFHSGQIQNETISLMILLILAFSAFLDGIHVGWHFSVIGILLAISAVIISYIDEYIWIIATIAILIVSISYYWNKFKGSSLE